MSLFDLFDLSLFDLSLFVWSLFGFCFEFVWSLFGVCLEFVWSLFGVCLEFVWSLFEVCFRVCLELFLGLCEVPFRSLSGDGQEFVWMINILQNLSLPSVKVKISFAGRTWSKCTIVQNSVAVVAVGESLDLKFVWTYFRVCL